MAFGGKVFVIGVGKAEQNVSLSPTYRLLPFGGHLADRGTYGRFPS